MTVDKRKNCLNLIRMLAASGVVVGHAIPAFVLEDCTPQPLNWLFRLLLVFEGVPVFFILSGFLLWDSIGRTPSVDVYLKKRVFRLYPELWGGVIVNLIVMLVLYAERLEWKFFLLYQFTQATVFQFWTPENLKNLATENPNGPLWTISVMVQAYAALWFFHKFLHKKGLKRWIPVLLITTLINVLYPFSKAILPNIVYKLAFYAFFTHIWQFLLGAFISEYFDRMIVFLKRFWWAALVLSYAAAHSGLDIGAYKTFKCLFLAIGIIGLGYALPKLGIKHDFSYGLYIYHMIVINVMVHFGCRENVGWLFAAYVIALGLAILSYFTVGALSRKLRERQGKSSMPLTVENQ